MAIRGAHHLPVVPADQRLAEELVSSVGPRDSGALYHVTRFTHPSMSDVQVAKLAVSLAELAPEDRRDT